MALRCVVAAAADLVVGIGCACLYQASVGQLRAECCTIGLALPAVVAVVVVAAAAGQAYSVCCSVAAASRQ